MLVEFRVENHRSIRDEQVLSMTAATGAETGDPRPRKIKGFAEPLLPVAVLYGANASGKSNVLSALAFMREAVLQSQRLWAPDGGVPRSPFAWGPKRAEPSLFEVTLIIVDELEASLHPMIAESLVRQFNDPEINTRNAQLIFTTHDTNLLGSVTGEPVLRRDQVWLTEKDPEGATVLYPLTDYKPRKAENLERGYLQGRYGAIPFLGNLSLAAE